MFILISLDFIRMTFLISKFFMFFVCILSGMYIYIYIYIHTNLLMNLSMNYDSIYESVIKLGPVCA